MCPRGEETSEELRDGGTKSFRVKDLLRRGSVPFDMSSIC